MVLIFRNIQRKSWTRSASSFGAMRLESTWMCKIPHQWIILSWKIYGFYIFTNWNGNKYYWAHKCCIKIYIYSSQHQSCQSRTHFLQENGCPRFHCLLLYRFALWGGHLREARSRSKNNLSAWLSVAFSVTPRLPLYILPRELLCNPCFIPNRFKLARWFSPCG